jgi:hypothetical protein
MTLTTAFWSAGQVIGGCGFSVDGMIEKNLDKGHAFLSTLVLPADASTTATAVRAAAAACPSPVCEPLALELLRRGLLPSCTVESGGGGGGGGTGRQARMPTVAGTFRTQLVCVSHDSVIISSHRMPLFSLVDT